jgi:sugar-specific transcriptional regulator TrmB
MLMRLGFSETEAETYCQLLRTPGATGYGVAQALKKSQANVYSALSSLTAKGAVFVDRGTVRAYRAVPPAELLPRLSREYEESCAAAAEALSRLQKPDNDDNIYQLKNQAQVYDRAASMCGRARESIAFELFHSPFERLRGPLADAVARGVGVAGVTFTAEDGIEGAQCVLAAKASRTALWPGDQLTLITDAREALVALLDRHHGEVLHAFYTDSTYLSCLLHAAVIDATILNRDRSDRLQVSFNKLLFGTVPSGFLELIAEEKAREA